MVGELERVSSVDTKTARGCCCPSVFTVIAAMDSMRRTDSQQAVVLVEGNIVQPGHGGLLVLAESEGVVAGPGSPTSYIQPWERRRDEARVRPAAGNSPPGESPSRGDLCVCG